MRGADDAVHVLLGRQRHRPGHLRTGTGNRVDDLPRRAVDDLMVIDLEPNADLLSRHGGPLRPLLCCPRGTTPGIPRCRPLGPASPTVAVGTRGPVPLSTAALRDPLDRTGPAPGSPVLSSAWGPGVPGRLRLAAAGSPLAPGPYALLEDGRDPAGTDGPAAFPDREPQALFHRDRLDQLDLHLGVVTRQHHLGALGQLHDAGHVRGAEVELRPVVVEERRVPPALVLGQDV